jgi:hypothetical protein
MKMNGDAAATSGISIGSAIKVRRAPVSRVVSLRPGAKASVRVRLGTIVPAANSGLFQAVCAKCLSHISANREVDHAEPRVFAFATVQQQFFLIAGGVRPKRQLRHARRHGRSR